LGGKRKVGNKFLKEKGKEKRGGKEEVFPDLRGQGTTGGEKDT